MSKTPNQSATKALVKQNFGSLSDSAFALYWRGVQSRNHKVQLRRGMNAKGLDELLKAKMVTTSKHDGVITMALTYKAISWIVFDAEVHERVAVLA